MKKFLALLLALVMVLSFAACGNTPAEPESPVEPEAPVEPETPVEPEAPAAATYKLGMGVVVGIDSSATGNAQADDTVAVVVTDADGKIVKCELDCAQTKLAVADGVLPDFATVDVRSKQEKKEDYNMVTYGGAIAEWYEQANAFAASVIGMTADEVAGIETVLNEEGNAVATDPDIFASCTMAIADFQAAIVKACNDEYAKEFTADEFTLGLGVSTDVSESTAPADDKDGLAALYTNFAGVVLANDGTILADLVDVAQVKVNFNAAGEITTDMENFAFRTKKELKNDYNMVTYGGAVAEWMDQATAYENYIVGMNLDAVNGMATVINEEGHTVVTDADPDLLATCTMSIADFQVNLTKAAANAR